MTGTRSVDRTTGWLGVGFLVTLLASEAALSLPDEHASAASVTTFYAAHRGVIIGLQCAGILACALLAAMAWRLRTVDRRLTPAGLVVAVAALAPAVVTMVIALVAEPAHPARAARYNKLEPRGDDLLFAGIIVFAVAVVVTLGSRVRWLGVLATIVALSCAIRLVLAWSGHSQGLVDTLAPVSFLVLVAALSWLGFRGFPPRATARP